MWVLSGWAIVVRGVEVGGMYIVATLYSCESFIIDSQRGRAVLVWVERKVE